MYRRRGRQSDFELAVKKFLEHGRGPERRLKSLRHAEEKASEPSEVKQLYTKYSSAIFFIFYSYFGTLESFILDKANKGRGYSEVHLKGLRETALPALERVLVYLPELIHKKWQYNSICLIIRKLLHPENILPLRKDGLRLLTLWLHALQSNAGDASMQLFASAVPYFPPQKTPMGLPTPSPSPAPSLNRNPSSLSLVERYGTYSSSGSASPAAVSRRSSSASLGSVREVVKVASLQPLHRAVYPGADVSAADQELTITLIHHLMNCLTEQVGRLHWDDPSQHLNGFAFLFFLFKLFYLACLFKNFRTEAGLYSQAPPPEIKVGVKQNSLPVSHELGALQEEESSLDRGTRCPSPASTSSTASTASSLHKKHHRRTEGYRMSQVIKLEYDLSHPIYTEVKRIILERVLSWLQPEKEAVVSAAPLKSPLPPTSLAPPSPLLPKPSFLPSGTELIAEMWFTARDNVNLLCEICRQSFLGSLIETRLIRRVIELYWSWVGGASFGEQPLFVMQPVGVATAGGGGDTHLSVPSDPIRASSPSILQPWEVIIHYEGHDTSDVCAGLQPALRMVICHISQVFLTPEREESRSSQLELCRRILRFYQELVMKWSLDHDSWEYLLATLLHLTVELLRGGPPRDRDNSLAANLAAMLLKTLFVCYLRASMVTSVSGRLWDGLCTVLASLTTWKEVIDQWEFVMKTMTEILAQTVYGLDLNNLPLQRLLKEESMIGKHRAHPPANISTDTSRLSSFSVIEAHMTKPNTSNLQANRLASVSRSADERRSRGMKQKALTVEAPAPESPPGRSRRYISIPAEANSYSSGTSTTQGLAVSGTGGGGGGKERSVSEVERPQGGSLELPTRCSSTQGHYRPILEEEEEGEGGADPVSPAISLPATVALTTSTTDGTLNRLHHSERPKDESYDKENGEEQVSLTITSHSGSPTPEPELVQSPGGISYERGGSVEPLISNQDSEKPKEKTKRSLFGRKLSFSSAGTDGKSRKKSAKLEKDLVFTNEGSDDTTALSDSAKTPMEDGKAVGVSSTMVSPMSPLAASWSAGVSAREKQRGELSTDRAGDGGGERREEEGEEGEGDGRVVSPPVYKSSSEGNIHRLSLSVTEEVREEGGREDSQSDLGTPIAIRRVVSSNDQDPEEQAERKRSIDIIPQDMFSSSIIPSSQARLLGSSPVGPRSQSPVLAPTLSPVHHPPPSLSSPQSLPSSQLAQSRGIDQSVRNGDGSCATTEGAGIVGGAEGSRGAEFPPTPLSHHMMLKKAIPIDHPRTPSPPITISPSSPPHSQVGWSAVVSAVVWQRMLRILGDINNIPDPSMYHLAFKTLLNVWRHLVELDANLGVSTDNQTTPPLPTYLPPMLVFLPWVLRACGLPADYLPGQTVAVQLLCEMNIRHVRTQPSLEQLTLFYQLLQKSLQPTSDTLNTAVRHCSKLFSHGLPGAGVLMADCIAACAAILYIKVKGSDVPRSEALCLLGSMLFLPHLSPQLKNRLVATILTAACGEPTRNTRCMALHLVGMLVFSELFGGEPSSHVPEAVDILLTSLVFSDRSVSMTAIDMLTLLTEVAPHMLSSSPAMPARVLQGLCYSIAVFMTDPELEKAPWVNKVVVTLLMCLRDWLMVLPLQQMVRDCHLPQSVLREAFEVLQAAAISSNQASAKRHAIAQLSSIKTRVSVKLDPLHVTTHNTSPASIARDKSVHREGEGTTAHPHPTPRPFSSEDDERVQVAARSVLTHLINFVGHFPFGCGPAQMTSRVSEFHDAPSLRHLDDLSTDVFDSPRVQLFSFNDTAVVTLVEIPIEHTGLPPSVEPATYHTRVIVRDVTGKYVWDCAMLYGPQMFPRPDGIPLITAVGDNEESLATATEPASLDRGVGGVASSAVDPPPCSEVPLQPPSWKTRASDDSDILEDLLKHIEATSPECLLYPGVAGLAEPAPIPNKAMRSLEGEMVAEVQRQHTSEMEYTEGVSGVCSMCGVKETAPTYISAEFAFHHCRVLLSHLGMFSASRRDHMDLLRRNNQLILELKNLDSTPAQSRMTYKVAVLYVALGQEDKRSVLRNSSGSRDFEDFVAGLGWEVDMETHAGYMGGLKREFCTHTTLPYYATSSEEVLFHVSTRMPSKGLDVEQKVRHLGNDEVHIVWSEHWRDYRRTIFKTQFADILIVIYPLENRLFRIQIIKKQKQNIPLFGPLFDGALVNRQNLPSLVRATAINALRAQRSPLVGYRGRYEERLKYIQTIVKRKMESSFEEFTQNVMHPLESLSLSGTARVSTRHQTPELEPLPLPSLRRLSGGAAQRLSNLLPKKGAEKSAVDLNPRRKRGYSPRGNQLRLANMGLETWSLPHQRPRANTNEDKSRPHSSKSGTELHKQRIPRNRSVPEKLHHLYHTEGDATPPDSLSDNGGSMSLRRPVNIRRPRTASPSPTPEPPGVVPNRSGTS